MIKVSKGRFVGKLDSITHDLLLIMKTASSVSGFRPFDILIIQVVQKKTDKTYMDNK